MVLRIVDSRLLSRVRALYFLGTTAAKAFASVAVVASGLLLAMVAALTHVGTVPLVFIGVGLVGLLWAAAAELRELWARYRAPQPTGLPRAITPPRLGILGQPIPIPVDPDWENPDFPDVEMIWGQPERWYADQRIVFPIIRITNRSEDPVSLSFEVFQKFAEPAVAGGEDWMPLGWQQQERGLSDPLNLRPKKGRAFRDQGFIWMASTTDMSRSLPGCQIAAVDHLSGRRVRFADRWPPLAEAKS